MHFVHICNLSQQNTYKVITNKFGFSIRNDEVLTNELNIVTAHSDQQQHSSQ